MESAGDVGIEVKLRVADGWPYAGASGEVDDSVGLGIGDDTGDGVGVADISFVELNMGENVGDVLAFDRRVIEVVEVIDNDDFVAIFNGICDEVGSDESCAAAHKQLHLTRVCGNKMRGQGGTGGR